MCNEAREDAKRPTTSIALCKKWLMKLNCSVSVVGFNYFDPTRMLNWKKNYYFSMLESMLEVGTFCFSRKVLSWIWPMTTKHAKLITYQTKLFRRYSSIAQNITNTPSTSILSILCFAMSTTQRWGTFPVCRVGFGYHIVLGPLFWQCPHPWALL